jgi:hypothetical protein
MNDEETGMSGYLHPDYTLSLAEFGSPQELSQSKGWILRRQITGFPYQDAMGCYPLFTCENWSRLHVVRWGVILCLLVKIGLGCMLIWKM